MKKIIFGAGNYGRMAYEHFGGDEVSFFVDNNPTKCGKEWCGKKILSFEEYKEIWSQHETVIAVTGCAQIARQLQEAGITEFSFFSPQYNETLERLKQDKEKLKGNIAFCGWDEYTEILIKDILRHGIGTKQIFLAVPEPEKWKHVKSDIDIVSIADAIRQADSFVISASNNAYGMQTYLKNKIDSQKIIINPFIQKKYYETNQIVYNPYGASDHEVTEEEWNCSNKTNQAIAEIESYAKALAETRPLFEHIEIETINRCNGSCDFCPVSQKNDIRAEKYMDEALFHKIINQLAELNYGGRLALFSNNEPFLDERILEFHKYARKMLPNARMHLFTNGTLLTLDKFIELIKYLDELIIDNYQQDLRLHKNSQRIADYCNEHMELKEKVTIVLRKPHEILTSRGGDAPNRKEMPSYADAKCVLPFKQMIVRPDGKVSLCCNDPYGKCTLGDLNMESLTDVWYGKAFEEVRTRILKGRGELSHCSHCDTFILF